MTSTYDSDNIFAKILRGEAPAARVMEDEHTLVIMDLFPQSRGHCLVLPKTPAVDLLDVPAEAVPALFDTVRRVAGAVQAALLPEGIFIGQFNGAAAGQTVFHLHVHVIPRWSDQKLPGHGRAGMADPAELAALAALIARHL